MSQMGCYNPDPGVSLLSASGPSHRVVSRVLDIPRSPPEDPRRPGVRAGLKKYAVF